jgi:hypothetical protein
MVRDKDTVIKDDEIVAALGDKNLPAWNLNTGWDSTYENPNNPPARTDFNYLFYRAYLFMNVANKYGANLSWDTEIIYFKGALVVGWDEKIYISKINNNVNIDPVHNHPVSWRNVDDHLSFNNSSGQIRVLSGDSGVYPTVNHVTSGSGVSTSWKSFTYVTPLLLDSIMTHFPLGDEISSWESIYDNTTDKVIDYHKIGTQNMWQLTISWTKQSNLANKFVMRIQMKDNINNVAIVNNEFYISSETSNGVMTINFMTVTQSGPSKYSIETQIIGDNGSNCKIDLLNLTRYSFANTKI